MPGFLGDRDEFRRADDAALRIAPAQQRLDAARRARLACRSAAGRRRKNSSSIRPRRMSVSICSRCLHARVHVGGVEAIGVAAGFLGRVHRGIGLLDQRHARRSRRSDTSTRRSSRSASASGRRARNGARNDSRTRVEHRHRSRTSRAPGRVRAGSRRTRRRRAAPPCRVSRTARSGAAPTACSSWSPASWPSVSLMRLKWSKSRNRQATCVLFALRLRQDLLQPLVEQRAIGQAGEDVVLRELVRVRGGDLELLACAARPCPRACAGSARPRPAIREPLRHLVERVGEQAELVGRRRRHDDVELARADRARRTHQPAHRRDQAAGEQQRRRTIAITSSTPTTDSAPSSCASNCCRCGRTSGRRARSRAAPGRR